MIAGTMAVSSEPHWPDGLVELYRAERTSLVRTAFLICGSVAGAEDAVHDALPRVARRWDSLENGRAYLYVSVVNAARDAARSSRRTTKLSDDEAGAGDDPARLSDESMALHRALAKLPDRQRTAIVLRYFADWDDAEIAKQLGARLTTIRSLVHRGVARMREEMER